MLIYLWWKCYSFFDIPLPKWRKEELLHIPDWSGEDLLSDDDSRSPSRRQPTASNDGEDIPPSVVEGGSNEVLKKNSERESSCQWEEKDGHLTSSKTEREEVSCSDDRSEKI